jgi:hypothetical protein
LLPFFLSRRVKLIVTSERLNIFSQSRVFQPIKKPVRTLSIFTSMAFVKDANGISFKNRLKGHINWQKMGASEFAPL